MQTLKIIPMPTAQARAFQRGELDSNGQVPELVSIGGGPCRHCLEPIEQHEEMLVIGYCPFPKRQPYAETGPIFLHARDCSPYGDTNTLPTMISEWGDSLMIVRGYGNNDRIRYDAAAVVPANQLITCCQNLLADNAVAYLHIRAAQTNCYQFRIERG